MLRIIRRSVLALALATALVAPAAQATGSAHFEGQDEHAADSAGPMVDLFVLRPLGLVATALGVGLMAPAAVLMTVTGQPHHMDVPYEWLLKNPVQFTFIDPVGTH